MRTESPPSPRDLLREVVGDTLRFVRAEVRLLKAEGVEAGKRGAFAAGLLFAAALGLMLTVVLLLGAGAEAVGDALGHPWLGWLCVAGLILVITAILGLAGYRKLRRAIAEGRRVGTIVKEDLEWVRELPKQSANGS